jgi:multisubunit Na+/H+ antiporter MnhG subunit
MAGLAVQADSWMVGAKLALTWLLVMVAGATACYLVARAAYRSGVEPWRKG